jgi:SAM-dependent methyltransferase
MVWRNAFGITPLRTRRRTAEYDRERVARLFDDIACAKSLGDHDTEVPGQGIPQLTGQIALQTLNPGTEDVLLDVGTGTGETAIVAAGLCRKVIGIDVSRKSLQQARLNADREGLGNVVFAYGAFEDPCAELDLASHGITRILAVYSLHHLPDRMKSLSLLSLAQLLHRPARMVIGDIMFFDDPDKHRERFDEAGYDAGDTDFPASAGYLTGCLERMGAGVRIERIHPLVGIVTADFV